MPLAFHSPGSFEGSQLRSETFTWALLVFSNETAADFGVTAHQGANLANNTVVHAARAKYSDDQATLDAPDTRSEQWLPGPLTVNAAFQPRQQGSVLIMAERIGFELQDVSGVMRTKPEGKALESYSRPADMDNDLYRQFARPGSNDVVLTTSAQSALQQIPFQLVTHGKASIEWYNASVTCMDRSDCPTGGGASVIQSSPVPGYSVATEQHFYEILEGDLTVMGTGRFEYAVLGSANLTINLQGSIRLPLATGSDPDCDSCILPDNQTLAASGNITLAGLRMNPGGNIAGDVGGDLKTVRLDEAAIDPSLMFGGGVAVGVVAVIGGGLLLVKYLLAPFFTRNADEDLLANERRRRIHDFVVKNPGVHFREMLRGTGIPAGSGRFHVDRLVKAGLLLERRQRSSLRLFENHRRFNDSWQDWAALRDPNLRQLHEWLAEHPDAKQKDLLDAFSQARGWSSSTTQARLERLVRDGVAQTRMQGRGKYYSATKAGVALTLVAQPAPVPASS